MACLDCGTEDMPLDAVLTGEQWAIICSEGGVLCASCIAKRAASKGAISVTVHIDFEEDYEDNDIPGGMVFAFLKGLHGKIWDGLGWANK